jgi:hypothetical protein
MTVGSHLAAALLVAGTVIVVSACGWLHPNPRTLDVRDATSDKLDLFATIPTRSGVGTHEVLIAQLGPGGTFSFDNVPGTGECTTGPLIARDAAGHEIARREPPICLDETWEITAGSASPSR